MGITTATGVTFDQAGRWHNGWYGTGGLEWAWTDTVHFGVQYTHVAADSAVNTPVTFPTDARSVKDSIDMVELRVNLKFWSGLWGPFSK
jgi:hypothetical protein